MLTRRDFLNHSMALAGVSFFSPWLKAMNVVGQDPSDPHFFLQIFIQGGLDQSYLFDARPLEMTKAQIIQNYLGKEPKLYNGSNGGQCLRTELTDSLMPFMDRFSVVNGVVMSLAFDGHDQNTNMLLTGNAFGGMSFIPEINHYGKNAATPLSAIQSGFIPANIRNGNDTVPLQPDSGYELVDKFRNSTLPQVGSSLRNFVNSRYDKLAQGSGNLSLGAAKVQQGFAASPELLHRFTQLSKAPQTNDKAEKLAGFLGDCFKNNLIKSAVVSLRTDGNGNSQVDAHDFNSAQRLPKTISELLAQVTTIINYLRNTPYDSTRSFLDVTTVSFASEFTRTMRQTEVSFEKTGTNHNSLCNTFLVGGKGIRGGQVISSSDYQSADEKLSPAHLTLDDVKVKAIGRPFDFEKGTSIINPNFNDLNADNFLTANSMINTFQSLFGVPESYFRKNNNSGPNAKILRQLLA